MTLHPLHGVEAADRLALARPDDDGAPAAVTSVIRHGSEDRPHSGERDGPRDKRRHG